MSDPREPEQSFPSTTWVYEQRKIKRAAGHTAQPARRAVRWYQMTKRDRRKPLTLTITWRGGAECWYEIHARGSIGRFPGHLALHDVMAKIYGDHQAVPTDGPTA